MYLELVVGVVAIRVQPPVVGYDPGGVNREVIVGDGVGDVRVAPGVRVRGLHLQDGGPDGDILVYVVSLEKNTDVKNGDYIFYLRKDVGRQMGCKVYRHIENKFLKIKIECAEKNRRSFQ